MEHKYIKCPKCGNKTQADFPYCNYCGAKLENATIETEDISEKDNAVTNITVEMQETSLDNTASISPSINAEGNTIAQLSIKEKLVQLYRKYPKRIIAVGLAIIIAIIAIIVVPIVVVKNRTGEEEIKNQRIYEFVLDASYKFKNPSSVRAVSGKIYYYEIKEEYKENTKYSELELKRGYYISGNLRLSATNGWGATTTGYYHIRYDDNGKIEVENLNDTLKEYMDAIDKYPSLSSIYTALLQVAVDEYEECEIFDSFDIDKVNAMLDKKWNK